MKTFKLGELFCGPGGIAYGAKTASIKNKEFQIIHSWATDYDFDTCQTYIKNICPTNPSSVICSDVRIMDLSKKNNLLESINALAFGFPCNDFSLVGEQQGIHGKFGPLYQYGITVLKEFQPEWFLAENVSGLSSANNGGTFSKILDEMKNSGYRIYPHLYKFEQYGVPQARHRIIIIGIRTDLPFEYFPPSPEPYKSMNNTSRYALENPPIDSMANNNELTKQSKTVVERLLHIKPGENAFNANLPEHLRLNVKGAKISQIYKRLDPSKPAYTVTGSGGGGTHIYHYLEPRALTNRERARLQTFPDTYEFIGSKESVRKQIGMAVPVRGARLIFEAILNTFAGIKYPYVKCNVKD